MEELTHLMELLAAVMAGIGGAEVKDRIKSKIYNGTLKDRRVNGSLSAEDREYIKMSVKDVVATALDRLEDKVVAEARGTREALREELRRLTITKEGKG